MIFKIISFARSLMNHNLLLVLFFKREKVDSRRRKSQNEYFIFAELQLFVVTSDLRDVAGSEGRVNFADENVSVVDLPAYEHGLAVFRVTGDEGVLGNIAISTGSPVAGGSTHQNLKVGLGMCVVAPSDE